MEHTIENLTDNLAENQQVAQFSLAGRPIQFIPYDMAHRMIAEMTFLEAKQAKHNKPLLAAGVAPTRFNLSKLITGKYGITQLHRIEHEWRSLRAKNNWAVLRKNLLDIEDAVEEDNNENESEEQFYNISISQGFTFRGILKSHETLVDATHHIKTPIHYMDGSLVHETEDDQQQETSQILDDENVHLDQQTGSKRHRLFQIATIDRRSNFKIWDAQTLQLKSQHTIKYRMSHIVFIQRNYMYCGVIRGNIFKFFTPKMDFTGGYAIHHDIQFLMYNEDENELVAAGTNDISIWSLDAVHQRGAIRIQVKNRLNLDTGLEKDKWIDGIFMHSKLKQLYVIVDTGFVVFDTVTGKRLEYTKKITTRRISCLAFHDDYQYLLIGSVDGSIKVVNTARATVHNFTSHTRKVISICCVSKSNLFMACGLDEHVRMFNLKTFKELTSFRIREPPLHLNVIDEHTVTVQTRKKVLIWNTSHFNINFATLSSNLTHLARFPSQMPPLIVARTADGVIRLISPANARTISATLPLLETDTIMDIVYHRELNRIFVMLQGGEIWVFKSDVNPMTLIDTWKSVENTSEHCTHLVIADGQFTKRDYQRLGCTVERYAFLFGGTANGHLLVYGRGGSIIDRYQIHMAGFTAMIFEPKSQCLISTGLDEVIHISEIHPFEKNLVQIKIAINAGFIPRNVAMLDSVIAATSDDASLHMFEIRLKKAEWRVMPGHLKTSDHSETVIGICTLERSGLFATVGKDMSLRIWNKHNKLVRDIAFQEPLEGVCVANERGDLLLAIKNRIDLVKCSEFLPPDMFKDMNMEITTSTPAPILFDDSLIPQTRSNQVFPPHEHVAVDLNNPLEVFNEIYLPNFEEVYHKRKRTGNLEKTRSRQLPGWGTDRRLDIMLDDIDKQINTLRHARPTEHTKKPVVTLKQTESVSKQEEIAEKVMQEQISLQDLPQPEILEEHHEQIEKIDFTTLPSNHRPIRIAPDGYIPNSALFKDVDDWKTAHGLERLGFASLFIRKKPKEEEKVEVKKVIKEDYKNRLKNLVQEMMKEEEPEPVVEEERPVTPPTPVPEVIEPVPEVAEIEAPEAIVIPVIEVRLPQTIEKFMSYSWFPENQVFYERTEHHAGDSIIINSLGKVVKKPKIDGSPESFAPILLDCFLKTPKSAHLEIVEFTTWLSHNIGFHDPTILARGLCKILQENPTKSFDTDEVKLRCEIMDLLGELCPDFGELVPSILPYIESFYNSLKFKAMQILQSMGMPMIDHDWMHDKIHDLIESCQQAKIESMTDPEKKDWADIRFTTVHFLRTQLHEFLCQTAPTKDLTRKIQQLTIFGIDDKKKVMKKMERKQAPPKLKLITEEEPKIEKKRATSAKKQKRKTSIADLSENVQSQNNLEEPQASTDEYQMRAFALLNEIVDMRFKKYPISIDPNHYPKLNVLERMQQPVDKSAVKVLQDPCSLDFIDALNFFIHQTDIRLQEEARLKEEERQKEILARKMAEEKMLLAAQQREMRERLANERMEREKARLAKLAQLRAERHGEAENKGKTRMKRSEMRTKGIGLTHASKCHHSREHLDMTVRLFPEISSSIARTLNNSQTVTLMTMNKPMAMERVSLDPFADPKPKTSLPNVRPNTTQADEFKRWELVPRRPKTHHTPENDISFIRGEFQEPKIKRQYFVSGLAFADADPLAARTKH